MTRTPLTAEQYSELVVALEMLREEYIADNGYRVERTLRTYWLTGHLSAWLQNSARNGASENHHCR